MENLKAKLLNSTFEPTVNEAIFIHNLAMSKVDLITYAFRLGYLKALEKEQG